MNNNDRQVIKDYAKRLPRLRSLQFRALACQVVFPSYLTVAQVTTLFLQSHPKWGDQLVRVKNMIKGVYVSNEAMLEDFEKYCEVEAFEIFKAAA